MASRKKSEVKNKGESAKNTAISLAVETLDRKRHSAKRLYSSIKVSLGLLASLILILIATSIVLFISGLIWLSQNTPLSDNSAIFLSGAIIGYATSILVTLLYVKYITPR